jgi:hypothetical protein
MSQIIMKRCSLVVKKYSKGVVGKDFSTIQVRKKTKSGDSK